jgi:hypothetical protein
MMCRNVATSNSWSRSIAWISTVAIASCANGAKPTASRPSTGDNTSAEVLSAKQGASLDEPSPEAGLSKPTCAAVFHLCASFVEAVESDEQEPAGHGYQVYVRLTGVGQKSFENFTADFLGQRACVVAGSETVFGARVMAVIPSGVMVGQRPDLAGAKRLVTAIRTAPAGPCGP